MHRTLNTAPRKGKREVARYPFPRFRSLLPKGIIGRAFFGLEHAVLTAFSPALPYYKMEDTALIYTFE